MRGTLRDQFRDKHPFFWVVVIAAVYGVCLYAFVVTMHVKYAALARDGYDWDNEFRITRIYPNGPAEGKLQVGDKILKIDDQSVIGGALWVTIVHAPLNTEYILEVERNGATQQVPLRFVLHRKPEDLISTSWQIMLSRGFLSLPYLILGILVGLLKPANASARLLSIGFMLVGVSAFIAITTDFIFPVLTPTEKLITKIFWTLGGQFITFAVIYRLFLRFPQEFPKSWFWNTLGYLLFIGGAVVYAGAFAFLWAIQLWGPLYVTIADFYFTLAALAGVAVLVRNYRLVKEPQQRQRFKWLVRGVLLGSLPSTLWILAKVLEVRISPTPSLLQRLEPGMTVATSLLVVLVPTSMAYAILKHRVLDINVVIRRSLRYLLASRGFILIEALLAFAVLSFIFAGRIGAALDRLGSNTRTLVTILSTVLMVLGLQTVNRKIRPLIDRRFFREAYDAQQILTELTSSLRATTNVNQVLELTSAKIQQALYAANVTIFLRNGQRDFQSAVSSDYDEREKSSRTMKRDLHLPDEAFVVQRVQDSSQPAEIDWDDPYSPVATQLAAMANGDAAAQQEFDTLRILKTNLVLPLAAKNELLGVLALGPRAGDLPYSREDKRMLMNVAGQTAMALENSRLVEGLIEEARRREEIETENEARAKELEDARRLQLSMLPKGNVKLGSIEITGTMRTATEVGGDYYDFLPLPDGRYCIVIGDATGHGMSAGLIVGMVKMGLASRLQAQPQIQTTLQPMIEDLNTALKQSLAHRGVGMCLGATIIDPVTLQVEVCSNGMPFPYHFTNGALHAIELKAQPLGFLKRVNVPTATLQLQPGEALIWVSDGFEERMNARHEEWGAQQVATALAEICQREASGEAMARELMAACDRASDGRSNDDDMTIVVVKAV
ncbi:MAG: SpoIIE family protein phosphatase [Blastocatellia bacterium]|nr:SpoIIE family protein phosphatase [Blastocatellia bacterium]